MSRAMSRLQHAAILVAAVAVAALLFGFGLTRVGAPSWFLFVVDALCVGVVVVRLAITEHSSASGSDAAERAVPAAH